VLVADGRWPPRRERVALGPMLVAGAWHSRSCFGSWAWSGAQSLEPQLWRLARSTVRISAPHGALAAWRTGQCLAAFSGCR